MCMDRTQPDSVLSRDNTYTNIPNIPPFERMGSTQDTPRQRKNRPQEWEGRYVAQIGQLLSLFIPLPVQLQSLRGSSTLEITTVSVHVILEVDTGTTNPNLLSCLLLLFLSRTSRRSVPACGLQFLHVCHACDTKIFALVTLVTSEFSCMIFATLIAFLVLYISHENFSRLIKCLAV